MNKAKNLIEFYQKKINSFIFRGLLSLYSIYLIYTYDDIIPGWICITIALLYPIIVFGFLSQHTKLRLFVDFIFIFLIISYKPILNVDAYFFTLLPIINNVNFTGRKRSYFLLYGMTILLIMATSYISYQKLIYIQYIPPLLFLILINAYTDTRAKYKYFIERLVGQVDEFYTNSEMISKPYEVYKGVIDEINLFFKKEIVDSIICFTRLTEYNKYVMVNASKTIIEYSFAKTDELDDIEEKIVKTNIEIIVNGNSYKRNYVYFLSILSTEYLFILNLKRPFPFYYNLISGDLLFFQFFKKYSKLLLSEKKMMDIERNRKKELSNIVKFAHNSATTMHFIRNRFSSPSNLAAIIKRIITEIPTKYRVLVEKEIKTTEHELESLKRKAEYLLNKDNNPISMSNSEYLDVVQVFSLLRKNWNFYFPNLSIGVKNNLNVDILDNSLRIKTNVDGFELILTDWISNMKKYSMNEKYLSLDFIMESDMLVLRFTNAHNLSK
ncbi:MAG: hypothetical protein LBV11_11570, partial [Bacillus cereus]|nr:hypothetical protein [Bacillus cereus]